MFLFSNSSTKTWHDCRRMLFNQQLRDGHGYTGMAVQDDLLYGTVVHEQVPRIWEGDESGITSARLELQSKLLTDPQWEKELNPENRVKKANEWGRMLEGHLYGIQRVLLPYLKERFHMLVAEGDAIRWVDEKRKIGLIAKPDTVLHTKEDGPVDEFGNSLVPLGTTYLEWKTLKIPDGKWHRQFIRNPQAWTGAMTLESALEIIIDYFMVGGLVKGMNGEADEFGFRRRSNVTCWGYWKDPTVTVKTNGNMEPPEGYHVATDGSEWTSVYTSRKGWRRRSTDEYPGGVKAWVNEVLSAEQVSQLFVLTEPVIIDWDLAEEWLRNQKPLWEAVEEYQKAGPYEQEEVMERAFPRELSQCEFGPFGKPCVYQPMCHNPVVADDPLGSGMYKVREDHHPLAVKLKEEFNAV